jgi:hypothetical protein
MRTFEYRLHFALALGAMLVCGESSGCEPPLGFVNPPRPEIAPLEELVSHTEVKEIDQPLAVVTRPTNRPLRIDATKDLPGVAGTFRLSSGPYGSVGARRLVCTTDGYIAVEEVLLTESTAASARFRYVVWNYTSPKYRDVEYAVGEFVRTQSGPDRTHVNWTYRYALKKGLGSEAKSRFQKIFLERELSVWMRTQLDREPSKDEATPPANRMQP